MKNKSIVSVILFLLLIMAACVPAGGLKPFSEMTPKEKATFFMSVYNSQAADYRSMAAMPNLTDDQKDLLRAKKNIMVEIYPLMQTYNAWVESNAVPSPQLEMQIIDLLNQLTQKVIVKID